MSGLIDDAFLISALRHDCNCSGSQRKWAKANGFSPAYVSDVLSGRRDVSENLAAKLGFRRVRQWERIPESEAAK
jgi:DNA-binding transcriptional regulator YdaS (Cro superfamily)